MTPSSTFLDLIGCEGLSLKPYLDKGGKPTIGKGCTHYEDGTPVTMGDKPITAERAQELMLNLANEEYTPQLRHYITAPIVQHQFDALLSFLYNVGAGTFRDSSVCKLTNAGRYAEAAEAFLLYDKGRDKATGELVVQGGLVKRRAAERAVYLGHPCPKM